MKPIDRVKNRRRPGIISGLVLVTALLGLVGCSGHYPADPDGTLDRVSGGSLRVGISHQPPWTDTLESANEPSGIEAQLITNYAESIDADVEWHHGGEEQLITLLSERELDVVIGGLTDQSPWDSDAALTTSYAESIGVDSSTSSHVMAVQMGENAFMSSLEEFLLEQEIAQQVPEEMRP